MSSDLNELNKKIDNVLKDQQKMMLYLYNDKDTDNKGLVQQVKELKVDVDTIKEENRFKNFKIATFSTIIGAITGYITKLIW